MTDTTDQQAVTATLWLERAEHCNPVLPTPNSPMFAAVAEEMEEYAECKVAAFARLASVSSASADGRVREAFLGVMRGEVVNGGAWSLHLHFGRGDGARDRMRAASNLLGSIVTAPPTPSATTSQEGEWVTVPREPTQDQLIAGNGMFHTREVPLNIYRAMLGASPEPVPATNQAGEVERLRTALRNIHYEAERENGGWVHLKRAIAVHATAALATQPATSQEGEAVDYRALLIETGRNAGAFIDDRASDAFLKFIPEEVRLKVASLAATPTPPTLSEDLRGSEDGTALGEVQCACSDDDGVPDVGVSVGLGNGKALWIGETLLRDGSNIGVVFHGPDQQRIVAPLPDETDWQLVADILRHHVAPALLSQGGKA